MTDLAAIQQRLSARAAEALSAREQERERNRRDMPLTAAFLDEWMGIFGRFPRGRFTENGRVVEWGKRAAS